MSEQPTLTIQQARDLAVQHHKAGRLSQAENIYQQILQNDPNQSVALHLLGVIAHQKGRNDTSVDLITKALSLKPDLAEAHSNLGAVLRELGNPEEAVASCRKALDLKPDYIEAHYNLGVVLQELGKLEEAVASFRKALGLKPDHVEAHNNLGGALWKLGNPEEAISSFRKALDLKPDYAEAHNNLGNALRDLGKPVEALTQYRRAIFLDPQNDFFWTNFASCLESVSFASVDDNLYQDLLQLLEHSTVRPSYITRSVISALRHHPDFSAIVEAVGSSQQDSEILYGDIAKQLSKIPLFLRILELTPISDLEIERMLTVLRHAMLEETIEGKTEKKVFPFSTALAHNCCTNEYVFAETEEEKEAVEKLEQQIATLVKKDRPVPPSFMIALGAYRPLFQFSWAARLSERKWEDDVKSVIERQITEPLEEQSLRDQIPCITDTQNAISQLVRAQYEENPYPRWIKTGIAYKSRSLGAILKDSPLSFDLGDYTFPESPEILVAGCGTGQHALGTASRYLNAHVLAVDLSLSSLSYAKRKTKELGFSNIEYVQGDLTKLEKLERRFDLVECVGVLHHLDDPLAGWQTLVNLLRPEGVMKIGLYSEIGRQHIIAERFLIAEADYSSSPDNIRRCRQKVIGLAAGGNSAMAKICNISDFFNMSECRDLLFHVQEHRFTLPQVEAALKSLHLKFLGFEIRDQRTLRQFRESHPNTNARTSLPLWHAFELDNPDTFIGMYQFWCQKL